MKKLLPLVALLVAAYFGWSHFSQQSNLPGLAGGSDTVLANAFEQQRSGFQTQDEGVVVRILSDDNDGSRHQRFILKLQSGQTVLVAHNIDVAPRIPSLREGDVVSFNGEYEWNPKGGVIHWTHHDPAGRHVAGWIRRNGTTYQ